MPFAPPLFTALVERLAKAHNANVERRMSVVVTGLADTVRAAKSAIAAAGTSATRLKNSAEAVVATIGTVDGMTKQLDAANADLQGALAEMTNGDPNPGPLPDTTAPAPPSVPAADIPTALAQVANANVAAAVAAGDTMPKPPVTPYVAPPVVTASTIAAQNKANEAAVLAAQTSITPVKPVGA